jgi:hypothetical protein
MIMGIAALVFIPLLAIAIAHFLWSIGRTWPIRDADLLAKTVIGRPEVKRVPKLMSFLVAVGVLAAGLVALSLADHAAGGATLNVLGIVIGGIFIARGIAGYTPRWRAAFPSEPFATLDRKTYSPLCLFIGAGYLLLVLLRLT